VATTFFGVTMKPFCLLPVLILALASCTAPVPAREAPSLGPASGTVATPSVPSSQGARTPIPYRVTTGSGAEINFLLPTSATDPPVAAIEAYRVKAGATPVSYLVADVDNRRGTVPVNLYAVSVFDAEGRRFTFSSVADVIHSWGPTYSYDFGWRMGDGSAVDEAVAGTLKREATELHSANMNTAVGAAGQTRVVLASSDAQLPAEFVRVTVQPFGMGVEVEAAPAF
jgi:hypothetical protein